jgi:hypothetical protein
LGRFAFGFHIPLGQPESTGSDQDHLISILSSKADFTFSQVAYPGSEESAIRDSGKSEQGMSCTLSVKALHKFEVAIRNQYTEEQLKGDRLILLSTIFTFAAFNVYLNPRLRLCDLPGNAGVDSRLRALLLTLLHG